MSGRRAANRIRGPQSALTDFLAANNISAQQIRDSYEQRRRNADNRNAASATPDANTDAAAENVEAELAEEAEDLDQADLRSPTPEPSRKRKRKDDKTKEKLKVTKKQKKGKGKKGSDEESDDDYDDALATSYRKAKPLPGQLENCEVCGKRFTVTAYSKEGPEGGLLCMPCGRELAKESGAPSKKTKKAGTGKIRRKTESNRLDGLLSNGPKTLQQLCIEKVADQHLDIEEFGDLPDSVLNRLSEIFAKRRVLDPRTFRLFLRPDLDTVAIHDCAKLETEDYRQIFAVVPTIKSLVLRNASQLKDSVIEYLMDKATHLKHFQVYAANLVTNEAWIQFFMRVGPQLETLKLTWLDACFTDEVVECLVNNCTNLRRLKLKYCRQITSASLPLLTRLSKLNHLSLRFSSSPQPAEITSILDTLGPNLETLSLENFTDADDSVLDKIREKCSSLSKLRLTDVDCVTDAALARLFSQDSNVSVIPPLSFIDLSNARFIDNINPEGPTDEPIGLGSTAFTALMAHSGRRLSKLNIVSCRHISHAAFCDVFGNDNTYPDLEEIDMSFCNTVDTAVIHGIFRACPRLRKLVAFGCFKVEDVVVPKGLVLVGLPRAQDVIEQFGDAEMDTGMDVVASGVGTGKDKDGVGKWAAVEEMVWEMAREVEVGA